ncbi:MAG: 6-carboxytetrahydropterin synthase QueD [Chloroflexi bacterium]|nr:6-carboxytetrahydropterin synthase QueD [Chloroflexota bacterium]
MFQVSVEDHFDAAHFLRDYHGKCENLHGHRYKVVARVSARGVSEIGLAYDFTRLRKHLSEILARFDHTCLNDVPPFDRINPSSENIAVTVFNELKPRLASVPVTLSGVEVWETPQSWVLYTPD